MADAETTRNGAAATLRSSVRFRVIAGIAVIMALFTGLTGYSIMLHRGTVAELSLINSVYLPLALGTAEIRSTQLVFNTLLDRLADDSNQAATREWLDTARRFRPYTLRRLTATIDKTIGQHIPAAEGEFISALRNKLTEVGQRYASNEKLFADLYSLMSTGRVDEVRVHIEGVKRLERGLDGVLRGIGSELDTRVTVMAERAAYEGARATWVLGLLTLAALLVAGVLVFSISLLLKPLRTLQRAVAEVAGGDLGTHIDVVRQDEIGELAAGFNRMTTALAERDRMLIRSERLATAGKMAAQVTHEIRNPLSSLGLNTELLEEELLQQGAYSGEAKELLGAIQSEIERLTSITESYLRFARLPAPEPALDDLNAMVRAAVEFMAEELTRGSIAVDLDLSDEVGPLHFDRGQLRQALVNLLRNGRDALPNGGALRIATRLRTERVELEVVDNGIGVPAESREQIFESFFSTKSSGTGLGLPLVRQICLAHGGDVRYEPVEAGGSRFVITLPPNPGTA